MSYSILGPLEVRDGERLVQLTRTKDRLLLAMLLVHPNQVVSTDRLLDVLWGDSPPASGLKALQFHISSLRDVLDPGRSGTVGTCLQTRSPGYVLEVATQDIDIQHFRRLVDNAHRVLSFDPVEGRRWLTEALALWRGPALADFAYAEFAAAEIQSLGEEWLAAVELLCTAELALDHHVDVIPRLSSLATEHPFREKLHALLITALYRSGRQADALKAFQDLRRRLRDELGIDPSAELVALESDVLLQSELLLLHPAPGRGPIDPNNLPAHLTTFIGRVEELAEVSELIGGNRLVTVTGAGGAGKTRLAIEVASALSNTRVEGVAFVDLAAVTDPALVDQAVLVSVEADELTNRSVRESVVDHLVGQNLLIVLDNCEHVVGAAASIAGYVLSNTSGVRVLATSQHVLKLPGERVYPLPPMRTSSSAGDAGELSSDAARLFLDHAKRARPGYVPSDIDAAHISATVRQLDGMPLAIELAAARVRMMAVSDIAAHLSDRLRLLTDGSPSLRRQETLEIAVSWSYELTQGRERDLFDCLSIFAGSFSHKAAAEVGAIDDPIEIFELLGRLVDKSLIAIDASGDEVRYRLLETLRLFGSARLDERGEAQSTANRHATYYLTMVREGDDLLAGPDQGTWQRLFRLAAPDIRKALDWLIDHRPDDAMSAVTGLGRYWYREGSFTEGMGWLERAMVATGPVSGLQRALALNWLAGYKHFAGLADESLRVGIQAVAMAREAGDSVALCAALNIVGISSQNRGQSREAIAYFEEAVDTEEQSDRPNPTSVLWNIGTAYFDLADMEGAERTAERLRHLDPSDGDRTAGANADLLQCTIAVVRGELEAARGLAESALAVFADLGIMVDVAEVNERLAEISGVVGDLEAVDHHLEIVSELRPDMSPKHQWRVYLIRARRALAIEDPVAARVSLGPVLLAAVDCQHPLLLSSLLHETSRLAFMAGDLDAAAILSGAVQQIAAQPGVTLAMFVLDQARQLGLDLNVSLGAEAAEQAIQRGARMETSEAFEIIHRCLGVIAR